MGQKTSSNGLGTAGFVLSLVGYLTCGALSPIAMVLSFFGMFKEPRGLAIAGFVLGLIGSAWLFVLGGAAIILGIVGMTAYEGTAEHRETLDILGAAQTEIRQLYEIDGAVDANLVSKSVASFTDGWGNNLVLKRNGDELLIVSSGPDGEFETPDDVKNSFYPSSVNMRETEGRKRQNKFLK